MGCPFRGLLGEVGMARGTRALPGVAAAWGPLVEIRAGRPAGFGRDGVSPSVLWVVGRCGDGPWDTGPTGGGSGLEPLVELRAGRPADLVGTVSHRPFRGLSVPWAIRSLSCPFSGLSGEAGMA